MQLGHSLARLSRAVGQTADLCEVLKGDLNAMRVLAASHAAQYAMSSDRYHEHELTRMTRHHHHIQVHDRC